MKVKDLIYFFQFVMIGLLLSTSACYYDSEEDLYPSIDCNLENIGFQKDVLPIIVNYCYDCHDQSSNFGNITLEGYEQFKRYVENGQLQGSIKHESGFSAMPKNKSKLLDCEIEKIDTWISEGALNN